MFSMTIPGLTSLLTTYGDFAVFACIAIESTGIPFPGETMLLVASISAGTTHQLSLSLVIVTLTNVSLREHICFTKKADAQTSPDRKKGLI
jgi:membrane protein DedA with SNARE-associated domain